MEGRLAWAGRLCPVPPSLLSRPGDRGFLRVPSDSPEALLAVWRECGLSALCLGEGMLAPLARLLSLPVSDQDSRYWLLRRDEEGRDALLPFLLPPEATVPPLPAQSPGKSPGARNRIILVGPMASGKSSVGRELAGLAGLPFFDCDALIEEEAGASIPEVFKGEGESGFRLREKAALARLLDAPPAVIATGGGAVLDPGNRNLIFSHGSVVWLHAAPSLLAARAGSGEGRPLISGSDPAGRLAAIYRERLPLYASIADWLFPTAGMSPRQIAEVLHDEIRHSI